MCVTERRPDADGFIPVAHGRRMQQPQLGDFVTTSTLKPPSKAGSRFRPLTLDDWHQVAKYSAVCAKGEMKGSVDSVNFANYSCAGPVVLLEVPQDSHLFLFCLF